MKQYYFWWIFLGTLYSLSSQAYHTWNHHPLHLDSTDESGPLNDLEEMDIVKKWANKYFKNRNNRELKKYREEILDDCLDYIEFHSHLSREAVLSFWRIPAKTYERKIYRHLPGVCRIIIFRR